MSFLLTFIGFAFILGVLIFIHESGHYFLAKALGIKVEVFSLGFGPKLLRFHRGGTEYCISALPLGGYVKMLGENPDESLRGSREEFLSRSKFERFLVLVMGASLNIVLAVVLMSGIFMYGVSEPIFLNATPVIGSLDPNGAAAAAGLKERDAILAVGGEDVATWRDMHVQVALNPNKRVDFKIRRDGELLTIPVEVGASERERTGYIGIEPYLQLSIEKVLPGGTAERAGVRQGDHLMKLEGQDLFGRSGSEEFVRIVSANAGRPLRLTLMREGRLIDLLVTPEEVEEKGERKGQVGVLLSTPMAMRQYGPFEAVVQSLRWNWEQSGLLFLSLKKLLSFELSPRTLSGPLEIFRMTGEALRSGWMNYVQWMAVISLQLGVVNLLPIPVLDGGHIFILFVEGLMRRDLSMRIKERMMQFGFILLLLIMGGVLFLDFDKNWTAIKNFFIQ